MAGKPFLDPTVSAITSGQALMMLSERQRRDRQWNRPGDWYRGPVVHQSWQRPVRGLHEQGRTGISFRSLCAWILHGRQCHRVHHFGTRCGCGSKRRICDWDSTEWRNQPEYFLEWSWRLYTKSARPSPPRNGVVCNTSTTASGAALRRRCRVLLDRAFMTLRALRPRRSRMRRVLPAAAMLPLLRLRLPARPRCPRRRRERTPRRRHRPRL